MLFPHVLSQDFYSAAIKKKYRKSTESLKSLSIMQFAIRRVSAPRLIRETKIDKSFRPSVNRLYGKATICEIPGKMCKLSSVLLSKKNSLK
jgi:hypothetical protein